MTGEWSRFEGVFVSPRLRGICSCLSRARGRLDLSELLAKDGERLGRAETPDPDPSLTGSHHCHWMI